MTSRLSTFGRAFLDAFLGRAPSPTPADPSAQSWWRDFVSALAGRTGMAADAARTPRSVPRPFWVPKRISTLERLRSPPWDHVSSMVRTQLSPQP